VGDDLERQVETLRAEVRALLDQNRDLPPQDLASISERS
jgi:exonuclease V gamma subunit